MNRDELTDHLPEEAIVTQAVAADWRAALRLAGGVLVATGATDASYTDAMVAAVEEHGPYIVIAPGFALAHARPSAAVHRNAISWVALAEPVRFGSATNDPVRLVVGLAARDHDSHLELMAALAAVLADETKLSAALAADTPARVRAALSS